MMQALMFVWLSAILTYRGGAGYFVVKGDPMHSSLFAKIFEQMEMAKRGVGRKLSPATAFSVAVAVFLLLALGLAALGRLSLAFAVLAGEFLALLLGVWRVHIGRHGIFWLRKTIAPYSALNDEHPKDVKSRAALDLRKINHIGLERDALLTGVPAWDTAMELAYRASIPLLVLAAIDLVPTLSSPWPVPNSIQQSIVPLTLLSFVLSFHLFVGLRRSLEQVRSGMSAGLNDEILLFSRLAVWAPVWVIAVSVQLCLLIWLQLIGERLLARACVVVAMTAYWLCFPLVGSMRRDLLPFLKNGKTSGSSRVIPSFWWRTFDDWFSAILRVAAFAAALWIAVASVNNQHNGHGLANWSLLAIAWGAIIALLLSRLRRLNSIGLRALVLVVAPVLPLFAILPPLPALVAVAFTAAAMLLGLVLTERSLTRRHNGWTAFMIAVLTAAQLQIVARMSAATSLGISSLVTSFDWVPTCFLLAAATLLYGGFLRSQIDTFGPLFSLGGKRVLAK